MSYEPLQRLMLDSLFDSAKREFGDTGMATENRRQSDPSMSKEEAAGVAVGVGLVALTIFLTSEFDKISAFAQGVADKFKGNLPAETAEGEELPFVTGVQVNTDELYADSDGLLDAVRQQMGLWFDEAEVRTAEKGGEESGILAVFYAHNEAGQRMLGEEILGFGRDNHGTVDLSLFSLNAEETRDIDEDNKAVVLGFRRYVYDPNTNLVEFDGADSEDAFVYLRVPVTEAYVTPDGLVVGYRIDRSRNPEFFLGSDGEESAAVFDFQDTAVGFFPGAGEEAPEGTTVVDLTPTPQLPVATRTPRPAETQPPSTRTVEPVKTKDVAELLRQASITWEIAPEVKANFPFVTDQGVEVDETFEAGGMVGSEIINHMVLSAFGWATGNKDAHKLSNEQLLGLLSIELRRGGGLINGADPTKGIRVRTEDYDTAWNSGEYTLVQSGIIFMNEVVDGQQVIHVGSMSKPEWPSLSYSLSLGFSLNAGLVGFAFPETIHPGTYWSKELMSNDNYDLPQRLYEYYGGLDSKLAGDTYVDSLIWVNTQAFPKPTATSEPAMTDEPNGEDGN